MDKKQKQEALRILEHSGAADPGKVLRELAGIFGIGMCPENTEVQYLYRDASNYKRWNTAVVEGTLTEQQKNLMFTAAADGFIPEKVGLPADRLDEYPRCEDDHEELEMTGLVDTDLPPTVGLTADKLYAGLIAVRAGRRNYEPLAARLYLD